MMSSPLAQVALAVASPPTSRPQVCDGQSSLSLSPPHSQTATLLPQQAKAHAFALGLPLIAVCTVGLAMPRPRVQTAQLALSSSTLCRSPMPRLAPPSLALLASLALTPQTSPLNVTIVTRGFSPALTLPKVTAVQLGQGEASQPWQLAHPPAVMGLPQEGFMNTYAVITANNLSLLAQQPMLLPWQAVGQLPVAWQRLLKQAMAQQLALPVHRFGVRAIAGPVAMGWQRLTSKQYQQRTGQALPQGQGAFAPVPCATPLQAGWWVLGQRYPTSARQSLEAWLPADALPTVVKGEAHAST
jgi:hypothetical protein